jgi:uncharacterized membrane protein YfcA
MLPIVMMGSMIGVLFNIMLPSIILQLCLTTVLVILAIHTSLRARSIYKIETEHLAFEKRERKKHGLEED